MLYNPSWAARSGCLASPSLSALLLQSHPFLLRTSFFFGLGSFYQAVDSFASVGRGGTLKINAPVPLAKLGCSWLLGGQCLRSVPKLTQCSSLQPDVWHDISHGRSSALSRRRGSVESPGCRFCRMGSHSNILKCTVSPAPRGPP